MSQLATLQNGDENNGVWCDTYVDRTFHWAKTSLIPYNQPWIGFIHHTFDTEHSDYNNVNLLKKTTFLESLVKCKGIFVFSQSLKTRWDAELSKRGFTVPVEALIHPTATVPDEDCFSMSQFNANPNKKLVSVGAWLRDVYAIYKLNNGKGPIRTGPEDESLTLTKAALQGPKMQGYFKPANFFRIFTQPGWRSVDFRPPVRGITDTPIPVTGDASPIQELRVTSVNGELPDSVRADVETPQGDEDWMCRDPGICRDVMCRDSTYALNKYVLGAVHYLKQVDDSVAVLPTASDAEYDVLLKQNIVFIKLLDAGAVNTVLECVVRNTPIVVNRLPSIVEILGDDYPLFYDDIGSVPDLLTLETVTAAHAYLKALDKTKVSGTYFIQSIVSSDVYKSL